MDRRATQLIPVSFAGFLRQLLSRQLLSRNEIRSAQASAAAEESEEPLWMRIWRSQVVSIGIAAVALAVLTAIIFFQNVLVRRPRLYTWVRRAYLVFVLVWLGWYGNAQLSVVNVLTFTRALVSGFHWEFFLAAPLICRGRKRRSRRVAPSVSRLNPTIFQACSTAVNGVRGGERRDQSQTAFG